MNLIKEVSHLQYIYSQQKASSIIVQGFPLGATSSGAEKCISFPHLV